MFFKRRKVEGFLSFIQFNFDYNVLLIPAAFCLKAVFEIVFFLSVK